MPHGRPTTLKIQMTARAVTIYFDGVLKKTGRIEHQRALSFTKDVSVYVADNAAAFRQATAAATIRNFRVTAALPETETAGGQTHLQTTAASWQVLPTLVPNPHLITDAGSGTVSAQGGGLFNERFCPTAFAQFVSANTCSGTDPTCESSNTIMDGGSDMYDLGNFLLTSLMGSCSSDPHDCALGSLRYRGDFEPCSTNCFGAGGSYRMAQYENMWVFLSHITTDSPLDFMVFGELQNGSTNRLAPLKSVCSLTQICPCESGNLGADGELFACCF